MDADYTVLLPATTQTEPPCEEIQLADSIFKECLAECNITSLNTAIYLLMTVVYAPADAHSQTSRSLEQLADAYLTRFSHTGNWEDMQRASLILSGLSAGFSHVHVSSVPNSLIVPVSQEEFSDLAEVEETLEDIVALATATRAEFDGAVDVSSLSTAILIYQEAITTHDLKDRTELEKFRQLSNALLIRFRLIGNTRDIVDAITLLRKLVVMKPTYLSCLCAALLTERSQSSLVEAVQLGVDAALSDMLISNDISILLAKADASGQQSDIDALFRQLQDTAHKITWGRTASYMVDFLASALGIRFLHRGNPADIDRAIELRRAKVATAVQRRGTSLTRLADALLHRFQTRGDPADIDSAIQASHDALDSWPPSHPKHATALGALAIAIGTRFRLKRDASDMDRAIMLFNQSLDLSVDDAHRAQLLISFGGLLLQRFLARGDGADLDKSIALQSEAVAQQSLPTLHRAAYQISLADAHFFRFGHSFQPTDLDGAIQLYEEILDNLPPSHIERSWALVSAGTALAVRMQVGGKEEDIDKAITLLREALTILPAPDTRRAFALGKHFVALLYKYDQCLDPALLGEAMDTLREASMYETEQPCIRFKLVAQWAHFAEEYDHTSALEAYEYAIGLLPELAMLDSGITSRQLALAEKDNVGLASKAAACAMRRNQNEKAVEFLEAGRSVFWSQALQLHSSLDELYSADFELAEKVSIIARQLESGSYRDVSRAQLLAPNPREYRVQDTENVHYRELNMAWIQALNDVRRRSGFEHFLRPKSGNELRAAAIGGPAVILNTDKQNSSTSTAFIVTSTGSIETVILDIGPRMAQFAAELVGAAVRGSKVQISKIFAKGTRDSVEPLSEIQDRLTGKIEGDKLFDPEKILQQVLALLWERIVYPVFRKLGLQKSKDPARLWWCPTGPFTFLPIHAAGIYHGAGMACVSDYVVSSYTPTLTALLNRPKQSTSHLKMTAIIEPAAPNHTRLPATEEELKAIQETVPEDFLTSLGATRLGPATVNVALAHLRESSIVHFACHGTQNAENPLDSGLILTDGVLKVSGLMRGENNPMARGKSMTLAFLSACETAKGDASLPDEAMHLAATMLFAGFRGVVATMWRMSDADGPRIAKTFYEHLFKGCNATANPPILPDLTRAAEALHIAVAELRANPDVSFSRWVPFVHYGL
ncbi:CHAT domain-containing protein [Mycena polygramma]|nr:CHAT domain-containing protein [Mycena polygramma]